MADLGTQPQQGLLPQGGGVLRHHQHHRMPGSKARQRQRGGKGAGGSFDDGLAGAQLLFLDGEGEHPLGKAVPGGAGGACKVQIGIQTPFQPAGGGIAPQLHDGAGAERLVKIGVDRHGKTPFKRMYPAQTVFGSGQPFGRAAERSKIEKVCLDTTILS